MSVTEIIGQMQASGIVSDNISIGRRAMGGGDHIITRLVALEQQAQQATSAEEVQRLLGEAAEYAMAAQHLEGRWRNPQGAVEQANYAAALRALDQAESSLQAMLARYRPLAQQAAQDLQRMEQVIQRLQSSGLLAQQPPADLNVHEVIAVSEIEVNGQIIRVERNVNGYFVEELNQDAMRALVSAGGLILSRLGGGYVMTAVLTPEVVLARSAMMAVGAAPPEESE